MHRDVSANRLVLRSPFHAARSFPKASQDMIALDFADADAILFHTCDTGLGSSGSPLLADGANGPEVIGINVGTYVMSPRSSDVSSSSEPGTRTDSSARQSKSNALEAIANTAILTAQFREAIEAFAAAPQTSDSAAH